MSTANTVQHVLSSIDWQEAVRAALLLTAGLIFSHLYARLVRRGALSHLPRFLQRLGSWLILAIFIATALHQLGFKLSVMLGAAGIFSVALGFAAQSSATNIISGLFVIGERAFVIGDIIQAGDHTGEVLSVDMLSVKLRTFDNRFVRIPNETIIKTDVVNLSRFPIRRADLKISIAYTADIAQTRETLLRVAANNPLCLEEPRPQINLQGFGESSVDIQFSVWAARENYQEMRNSIQEEIKIAFDRAGIEFPFPTRTVHFAATAPVGDTTPLTHTAHFTTSAPRGGPIERAIAVDLANADVSDSQKHDA